MVFINPVLRRIVNFYVASTQTRNKPNMVAAVSLYATLCTIAFVRPLHVRCTPDHGKTTLVDAMLQQSSVFRDNEQVGPQDFLSFCFCGGTPFVVFRLPLSAYVCRQPMPLHSVAFAFFIMLRLSKGS